MRLGQDLGGVVYGLRSSFVMVLLSISNSLVNGPWGSSLFPSPSRNVRYLKSTLSYAESSPSGQRRGGVAPHPTGDGHPDILQVVFRPRQERRSRRASYLFAL